MVSIAGIELPVLDPVYIVLLVDAIGGVMIAKRILHPILGNFDIALILQPMGDDKEIPPPKPNMTAEEQRKYVENYLKGKIFSMAGRIEFNPNKEAFRLGGGRSSIMGAKSEGFTYRVDPKKVVFLQRTHRVYEYVKGLAYPVTVHYGLPERLTTSKGMDGFVALRLWRDAIDSTKRVASNVPIAIAIMCVIMGLLGGFTLFYAIHTQLGFVPYVAPVVNATTHSTATLRAP